MELRHNHDRVDIYILSRVCIVFTSRRWPLSPSEQMWWWGEDACKRCRECSPEWSTTADHSRRAMHWVLSIGATPAAVSCSPPSATRIASSRTSSLPPCASTSSCVMPYHTIYIADDIYIYIHISDKLFSVYWWSSRLASRCTRRKGVIACFGEHRIENRVITWLVEWSIYIYILTRTHTWPVCSGTKLLLAEDGDSAASLYQALRSDQWFREVRIHVKVGGKREQEMGRRSTIHTH